MTKPNVSKYGPRLPRYDKQGGHEPRVQGLTTGVTAILAGYYHTCAIVNGGALCWGEDSFARLSVMAEASDHMDLPIAATSWAEQLSVKSPASRHPILLIVVG